MNNSLIDLEEVLSNPHELLREHNQNQVSNLKKKKKQVSAEVIPLFPKDAITTKPLS